MHVDSTRVKAACALFRKGRGAWSLRWTSARPQRLAYRLDRAVDQRLVVGERDEPRLELRGGQHHAASRSARWRRAKRAVSLVAASA